MKLISRILVVLILCTFLLVGLLLSGTAENNSDFVYFEWVDDTIAVVGYKGTDTEIVIPAEIDGCTVTSILHSNVYNKGFSGVVKITIPASVTSIGDSAFYDCESLTDLLIPNSITYIDRYAFANCSSLTHISIPNQITSINNGTFSGCKNLQSVEIPNSVTSIGRYAFSGCSLLDDISIPEGVTSIDDWAFSGCESLSSITIPESIASIGYDAFGQCYSLRDIYVSPRHQKYASIDGVLFDKDSRTLIQYPAGKTDEEYMIPDGIEQISPYAFDGCVSLHSVVIPDSIMAIGNSAFYRCASLERILIPETVSRIGNLAFSRSGLKSIEIPNGVRTICSFAFSRCENLTEVIIADSVTEIEPTAFNYCPSLTKVKLSNSLTSIDSVFFGCSGLTQISIPDSVKNISGAFEYCTALREVSLPNNLTEIGERAFAGCSALKSVSFPSGMRFIGREAFESCTALEEVDFTQSPALLAIDKNAFSGCTALTRITLSDSMSSLGDQAFEKCSSLEIVDWVHTPIPETLVGEGEINYLPSTDRTSMIRMMARHAACQKGHTVLPNMDSNGNLTDKEAWRNAKIEALEQEITEARQTIIDAQAIIADPETSENKKKAMDRRIESSEQAILEAENAIADFSGKQLLTDSEAQSMWEEEHNIPDAPESDIAIYELWQKIYVDMQQGNNLPEGYKTLTAYLTSEDGLRYMNNDMQALERITNGFYIDGKGVPSYLPGTGFIGIGSGAFSDCKSLKQITIPESVKQIFKNAFNGCPKDLMAIVSPGSDAEQFCIDNNIHYSYPQNGDWLNP